MVLHLLPRHPEARRPRQGPRRALLQGRPLPQRALPGTLDHYHAHEHTLGHNHDLLDDLIQCEKEH